jgi:hypothetical protein
MILTLVITNLTNTSYSHVTLTFHYIKISKNVKGMHGYS